MDEINHVTAGGNYGWPEIQGNQSKSGMTQPYIHSGNSTWAPSGIAFAGDELLMATLKGHGLYVADHRTRKLQPLVSTSERFRDVLVHEDGLYIITTNRSPRGSGPSKDHLIKYTR